MEDHTSFDLTAAIQRWRENLAESPNFLGDDLDELESHLRDSLSELAVRGFSAEEAFTIATRRIGPSQQLATEFARVNGNTLWIDRLLWMLLGAAFVAVVRSLFESMSMVLLIGLNSRSLAMSFLYAVLLSSPLILAVLAVRSLIRSRGTVPQVLTNLLQRPLGLSLSFFLLGLLPLMLKILAFNYGNVRAPQGAVAAGSILSLMEWIIVALFILLLARKRLRPVQT